MSSGMNSLAANLLEDFLQPMCSRWRGGEMSERQRTLFAKIFGKRNASLSVIVDNPTDDYSHFRFDKDHEIKYFLFNAFKQSLCWRNPLLSNHTFSYLTLCYLISSYLTALLAGILITAASFLPKVLGSSIFAKTQITMGTLAGPMAGCFFLAIVAPHVRTLVSWGPDLISMG